MEFNIQFNTKTLPEQERQDFEDYLSGNCTMKELQNRLGWNNPRLYAMFAYIVNKSKIHNSSENKTTIATGIYRTYEVPAESGRDALPKVWEDFMEEFKIDKVPEIFAYSMSCIKSVKDEDKIFKVVVYKYYEFEAETIEEGVEMACNEFKKDMKGLLKEPVTDKFNINASQTIPGALQTGNQKIIKIK